MLKKIFIFMFFSSFIITTEIEQLKTQELWKTIKQRIQLLKELKSTFKKEEIKEKIPKDFIPQSIAHLKTLFGDKKEKQLIRDAVIKFAGNFISIDTVNHIENIIENEKKNFPYYVFYHAQTSSLGIIDDFMNELYAWFNLETPNEKTKFLRLLKREEEFKNVDEYLDSVKEYMKYATFDRRPEIRDNLLSANFSLFGNSLYSGENTWNFYTKGTSINPPITKEILQNYFNQFNFNPIYIDKILNAYLEYLKQISIDETYPGILFQIFVNPNIVDSISYLADKGGVFYKFPLNEKEFDTYLYFNSLYYPKEENLEKQVNWRNMNIEKTKNLEKEIFDKNLNRFLVSTYLDIYRTKPTTIPPYTLDSAQARLYFLFFADPQNVQIIKYIFHPDQIKIKKAEKLYKQKLAHIIEEIIYDWLFNNRNKTKTRIENLFNYIQSELN